MRILIVGIGALGGTIATRALSVGLPVYLATRTPSSAHALQRSGLRVFGIGGEARARAFHVAPLEEYRRAEKFDLILLATKAQDALANAAFLVELLRADGTLLPIQNGSVAEMLAEDFGPRVLGGLSNLGATMLEPGLYEQRNPGHLLIGELAGGVSERSERIAGTLRSAIDLRVSPNMRGTVWAKLIVNCSITTVGAIAGQTMRQYMATGAGAAVFRRAYSEALSVALKAGVWPERISAEPTPPGWPKSAGHAGEAAWVGELIGFYGDLKPSMLQDFERRKPTEIDFVNGYVTRLGRESGVDVSMNAAITDVVRRIEAGEIRPAHERLDELLAAVV